MSLIAISLLSITLYAVPPDIRGRLYGSMAFIILPGKPLLDDFDSMCSSLKQRLSQTILIEDSPAAASDTVAIDNSFGVSGSSTVLIADSPAPARSAPEAAEEEEGRGSGGQLRGAGAQAQHSRGGVRARDRLRGRERLETGALSLSRFWSCNICFLSLT